MADAGIFLVAGRSKLGLAYQALAPLYREAFGVLRAVRQARQQRRADDNEPPRAPSTIDGATRALLLINADNYSALNERRRLVAAGDVALSDELRLLDLLFTKHPKSGDCWTYR